LCSQQHIKANPKKKHAWIVQCKGTPLKNHFYSFRSKLNIIEQEFKYAEKTEFWRLKEEEEMRRTIQIKRERALEDAKRIERARRIKEENRIRRGIISAVKNIPSSDGTHQLLDMTKQAAPPPSFTQVKKEEAVRGAVTGGGGFFVTQADTSDWHASQWVC
jgi:hypothetical protein